MLATFAVCAFALAPPVAYEIDFAAWPGVIAAKMDFVFLTRDGRTHPFTGLEFGPAAKATQVRDLVYEILNDSGFKVSKTGLFVLRVDGKGKVPILWAGWKSDQWKPVFRPIRPDK